MALPIESSFLYRVCNNNREHKRSLPPFFLCPSLSPHKKREKGICLGFIIFRVSSNIIQWVSLVFRLICKNCLVTHVRVCAHCSRKARAAHASTTPRLCRKRTTTRNKPSSLSSTLSRLCLFQNCDDDDDDDDDDALFFFVQSELLLCFFEPQRRRCVFASSFFRSEERDDALVVLLLFRRCCREKRRGVVVLLPSSSSPFDKIAARGSAAREETKPKQQQQQQQQQQRLLWGGKETRFVCFVVYVVICVR